MILAKNENGPCYGDERDIERDRPDVVAGYEVANEHADKVRRTHGEGWTFDSNTNELIHPKEGRIPASSWQRGRRDLRRQKLTNWLKTQADREGFTIQDLKEFLNDR